MSNKLIDIVNVTKSFDENVILDHLNLYIRENEFLTLLGPSGCGKTTLLRILGGFETPDSGDIIFDGKNINKLPPNRRQLNTVFQKYALFTHMTIAENIAFGLKIKKKSKHYIDDKIKYALKLVNLEDFKDRYPDSLSGGQQQRIAIARAIVNEPKVLLLDEPSNDLDVETLRALEEALLEFAGCALVTSHDRWFLDRIATHILAFEGDSRVVFFDGNYNEYEADKRRRLGEEACQPKRLRFKPLKH